jgi:hypothetical protein
MIKTQNIVRYYAATEGVELIKVMPPSAKQLEASEDATADDREIGLAAGQTVLLANDIAEFDFAKLDRGWYIAQARKLVEGFSYFNASEIN